MEMASIVLGKEAKQNYNKSLASRISDMSNDILNQVIIKIKNSQQKFQFNWMNPQILSNAVSS